MISFIVSCIIGFILGSIPSGLIVGKLISGIDIRKHGSKNIGTTNIFRTLGARAAFIVLLADSLKGVLSIIIVSYIYPHNLLIAVSVGFTAFLGHNYSIFLGFKGGKGVATALGILLYFMPKLCLIIILIWLFVVLLTKYVSLASIIAAFCVPFLAWFMNYERPLIFLGLFAAILVIIRHKSNISRLLNGTESKIKKGNRSK